MTLTLQQGADPNAGYTPMSVQEGISAGLQNTWPLRPQHMNLKLPTHEHALAEKRDRPHDHKGDVAALIVALDVHLDCFASHQRLPPRSSTLIKALIKAGANANAPGRMGHTPLMLAIEDNRDDIVSLLLKHHANVSAQDIDGNTSLMSATSMGNTHLVRLLLEQGADVNAKTRLGYTALMLANYHANGPDFQTVQVLLQNGAEVNAKARDGNTALSLAKIYANAKVVQFLKQAGEKRQQTVLTGR